MTREDVFPSKYLKAADLKGKPRIVKIESARYEPLPGRQRNPKDRSLLRERSQVATIERNELRRRLRRHRLSRHGRLAGTADRAVPDPNSNGREGGGLHSHPSFFFTPDGGSGTIAATAVKACQ